MCIGYFPKVFSHLLFIDVHVYTHTETHTYAVCEVNRFRLSESSNSNWQN